MRRLGELMAEAASMRSDLAVFPEAALTPSFPHWLVADVDELHSYFEREMPGPATRPLFELARRLGVGFCLAYAELILLGYNTPVHNPAMPHTDHLATSYACRRVLPQRDMGCRSSEGRQ